MLEKYVFEADGTLRKFNYELHKAIPFSHIRTLDELLGIINTACIECDSIQDIEVREQSIEEILGLILNTGIVLFPANDTKAFNELLRTFVPLSAKHKNKKLLSILHDILFKECKKDFLERVEKILKNHGVTQVGSDEKIKKVKNAISQKGSIKQYNEYMFEMLATMQNTLLTIINSPHFGTDELSLKMANSFFSKIKDTKRLLL